MEKEVCNDCGGEYQRIRQHWAMSDCAPNEGESAKVELTCAECGGTFREYRYRVESDRPRDGTNYCSRPCKHASERKGEVVECDWCGEKVYKSPAYLRDNDHQFCSKQCDAAWRSERMRGDGAPWAHKGRLTKHYVSAIRRRLSDEPWPQIAARVRQRADGCEMCGEETPDRRLDVHHIIPVAAGGTNEAWNLMVLCRSCHQHAEDAAKQYAEALI